MSAGVNQRESCAKCDLPVAIAERLNINNQLYHRTCFSCNLCNAQLTLAKYTETDVPNQFSCETCPKALSDQKPTRKLNDTDDVYSDLFEMALENPKDKALSKSDTLDATCSNLFDDSVKNDELDPVDHISVSSDSSVNISDSVSEKDNINEQCKDNSCILLDDTIITISSSDSDYPKDLNPFGDDHENETANSVPKRTQISPEVSMNPFDEDDNVDETEIPPQPVLRKKISVRGVSPWTSFNRNDESVVDSEVSLNPFDDDDGEDDETEIPPKPTVRRKISVRRRVSDNPYEDENELETPQSTTGKTSSNTPGTKGISDHQYLTKISNERTAPPKTSGLETSSIFGSNTSLPSAQSTIEPGRRKKKPAPQPPTASLSAPESAPSSLTSTPCTSAQHSPKSVRKSRKTNKAPIPYSSSPFVSEKTINEISISPILLDGPSVVDNGSEQGAYRRTSTTITSTKRDKGPAPSLPVARKQTVKPFPLKEINHELDDIELEMQRLEKEGVRMENIIRESHECEGVDNTISPEIDELILDLFEIVNEKNALFRRQTELMYLRRQHRLEVEHSELEYQMRCLILTPELNKTDSDKAREEILMKRLCEVVEQRNEIIERLDMDRIRESNEDASIKNHLKSYSSKSALAVQSLHKKKRKFKFKHSKKVDAAQDKDNKLV